MVTQIEVPPKVLKLYLNSDEDVYRVIFHLLLTLFVGRQEQIPRNAQERAFFRLSPNELCEIFQRLLWESSCEPQFPFVFSRICSNIHKSSKEKQECFGLPQR